MNQSELIRAIADDSNMSGKTVENVLKSLANVTTEEMKVEGGEVSLPGIGKLKEHTTAERMGRNPKTGDPVEIPAKNTVKFVLAKAMKDAIN